MFASKNSLNFSASSVAEDTISLNTIAMLVNVRPRRKTSTRKQRGDDNDEMLD
jgi:hypothetical protein